MAITGGIITTSGLYTIHTFLSSGTFITDKNINVDVLVVAGGGGGGSHVGAGGGAGGLIYQTDFFVGNGNYSVTVGLGGDGASAPTKGYNGQYSIFSSLTAIGGGGGQSWSSGGPGAHGGSGGGSIEAGSVSTCVEGQGNPGGVGAFTTVWADDFSGASGGGGAGGPGHNGVYPGVAGAGGIGRQISISGSPVWYAGGGGASSNTAVYVGVGGLGGGASGANNPLPATPNTGGGGGGAGDPNLGGSGGSGIVIIRYLTSSTISFIFQPVITFF